MKKNNKSLSPSELIINARGAIYHLDLIPGEIASTIITVGDPARVKKVSQYFDTVDIKRKHREFKTHTGTLNNKRISVISTGIGTDNIDIVMNEIDALFNIDFKTRRVKKNLTSLDFIRIGTSGALQENIPVDTFVANSGAIGLEGLCFFYGAEKAGTINDIPYYFTPGSDQLYKKICHGVLRGVALTAGGFYAPQGRGLRLNNPFRHDIDKLCKMKFGGISVSNMEMETAGIYHLANKLGHRAISLNAILANRVTGQFSSESGVTVDRLIRKVIQELRIV